MRAPRLLYDGLWRALCPAFDGRGLPRALDAQVLGRSQRHASSRVRTLPNQCRRITTGAIHSAQAEESSAVETENAIAGGIAGRPVASNTSPERPPDGSTASQQKYLKWAANRALQQRQPSFDELSVDVLVTMLRILRATNPIQNIGHRHNKIIHIVNHLVKHRGYQPDTFIYQSMMDAMADPNGSTEGIKTLWYDMIAQGIKPTSWVCHSALRALAIHPSRELRQMVVDFMRSHWYAMDLPAQQYVVVGLLREGQYELAFATLVDMMDAGRLDLWVYDIFIVELGRVGILDEMLEVLHRRKLVKATDDAFRSLLLHALDVFSQAYHHAGTTFVWNYVVKNGVLDPANGIVDNVLGTAARHGDSALGTAAIELLGARGRVQRHQHEALVEAFAASGDMEASLRILGIMEQNGMDLQRGSFRGVHAALKKNPNLIDDAVSALRVIREEHDVPLGAIAVIIEIMAELRGSQAAMPVYVDTFALSGKRPDYSILRAMIVHSSEADGETRSALARDYGVILPKDAVQRNEDMSIFEHLIPICAQAHDLDLALEFVEKAKLVHARRNNGESGGGPFWQKWPWVETLVDQAIRAEYRRIWGLLDEMMQQGEPEVVRVLEMVLRRHHLDKQLGGLRARLEARK